MIKKREILEEFVPISGRHCISCSVRQVMSWNKINISEAMIFGLSSSLNFRYAHNKYWEYPSISGRNAILTLENNFANAIGINVEITSTKSANKGYRQLVDKLKQKIPTITYVDMAEIPYLGIPNFHFGGHAVVVFGIDENEGIAYISDRDDDEQKIVLSSQETPSNFHKISIEQLKKARNSTHKPFAPNNTIVTFSMKNKPTIDKNIVLNAIKKNLLSLLNPCRCSMGISGIKFFADKLLLWKTFEQRKLKLAALHCFLMIDSIGGTGGGCFRKLYGEFLNDAATICCNDDIGTIGNEIATISDKWENVGASFFSMYKNPDNNQLNEISQKVRKIYLDELKTFQTLSRIIQTS